jgi:translocation and assembly module TamB
VMPEPVLTGSVRLQEGAIYIPSLDERVPLEIADVDVGQVGADTAVAAAVGPSALERIRISGLDVVVDEGVWLESDEANVQIRGELVVIRTGASMQMYGTLQALRGTYNLPIGPLYREFDVVSGSVRFLGTPDFNPEIDITAEHQVQAGTAGGEGSLAVLVHLTGTLQNPTMQLSSNTRPPLPESELLSYLVFGQPSFRLNQGTGALAQQLVIQEFVGGLLSRELGDLGLPCEYFRLRGRPTNILSSGGLGATSLECGIQLVEDVFLTVESGVLSNLTGSSGSMGTLFGMSLDWQVNDRITATLAREPVQAALGSMFLVPTEVPYQFSADVTGTWEFGRPAVSELPVPDLQNLPVESMPPQAPLPPDTTTSETAPAPLPPAEEPDPDPPEPEATGPPQEPRREERE